MKRRAGYGGMKRRAGVWRYEEKGRGVEV